MGIPFMDYKYKDNKFNYACPNCKEYVTGEAVDAFEYGHGEDETAASPDKFIIGADFSEGDVGALTIAGGSTDSSLTYGIGSVFAQEDENMILGKHPFKIDMGWLTEHFEEEAKKMHQHEKIRTRTEGDDAHMDSASDKPVVWYIPYGTKEEDFEAYRPLKYTGGANDKGAYKVFCDKRFADYHKDKRKNADICGDFSLYKGGIDRDIMNTNDGGSGSYYADKKKETPSAGHRFEQVTAVSIEVDDDGPGYKHHVCESCGSITGCMCPRPKKKEIVMKKLLRSDSNASQMLLALEHAEDVALNIGDTETLSALTGLIKEVARKSEASDVDLKR